ncbi:MAG TPA: FIST N-terminal domain-containing protein [Polyangiaceae bacterium]|jgi:methyl-accepting chemotaxis protein|nr:FIST N-terminal domain-containing protein [Polyangiaceae bacterium]
MRTTTATGSSTIAAAMAAGKDAAQQAVRKLGGAKPTYGFVFATPEANLGAVIEAACDASGAELIGCTTAGEIAERGLAHQSVVVMLVAGDVTAQARYAEGLKADPCKVADDLWSGIGEIKKAAAARDRRHLTTVLFADGLVPTGEKLVTELYDRRVQSGTQIVGGAAGDEGRFQATWVSARGRTGSDGAAALHLFGMSPWGLGADHGLRSTTKPMRVTKAEGNVVQEIEGQRALAVYEKHAAERGVRLDKSNAGAYLIANELGIHVFDRISRARAPLSVGADGSLVCAGDIPRGSIVSILDGDPSSMVAAARTAAESARAQLGRREAAGVLLFDCVCRGMILKKEFDREVDAVRSVFPDVPLAGFLTYGEIARSNDKLDGWHNATAVVAAIPA